MRWFRILASEQSPDELAAARRDALEACAPFKGKMRVDFEACIIEPWGLVVGPRQPEDENTIVIELDTIDEAIAFVAEANGTSTEEVERRIGMEVEYLHNLRTGKKVARSDSDKG